MKTTVQRYYKSSNEIENTNDDWVKIKISLKEFHKLMWALDDHNIEGSKELYKKLFDLDQNTEPIWY